MSFDDNVLSSLEELGDKISEKKVLRPGRIEVVVDVEDLRDVLSYLASMGFKTLASLSGVDLIKNNQMAVVYHLESYDKEKVNTIVAVKTFLNREDPRVPTVVDIFPAAFYHELEAYEMFGIVFEGRDDLGPLFLEDWDDIPPLRKDFKVGSEDPWMRAGLIK